MKNKVLLWLDDIRNPFVADWRLQYAPEFEYNEDGDRETVWVKNYYDFVDWIKENGLPHTIAFDHDLGEDVAKSLVESGMNKKKARMIKRESKSGFDAAKWLVDYCIDNDFDLPNWTVQSANPVGKDNINGILNNYRNFRNK